MSAPMKIDLPHILRDKDRHGNERLYYRRRKGDKKIRLREDPGTQAFLAEYDRARARSLKVSGPRAQPTLKGSFRELCLDYFDSAEFRRLAKSTRKARQRILESCLDEPIHPDATVTYSDFPVHRLDVQAITVLRDRKQSLREAANGRVKALRVLFNWAIQKGRAQINVAKQVEKFGGTSDGYHTWTEAEFAQYRATHPIGTKPRLAFELLYHVGCRRSDVVRLGRPHISNGWIRFTSYKGRNRKPIKVEQPMSTKLEAVIAASETGDMTFLQTEYGRAFSAEGFGNRFKAWCEKAGLPHCSAHGVRKGRATIEAENGATPHQLMAWFGWLDLKEAETYTKKAERRKLAASMVEVPTFLENGPHLEKGAMKSNG